MNVVIKNKTKKFYVVVDNSQNIVNHNHNGTTTIVLPLVQGTKQTAAPSEQTLKATKK
jgi:hypothetical protein